MLMTPARPPGGSETLQRTERALVSDKRQAREQPRHERGGHNHQSCAELEGQADDDGGDAEQLEPIGEVHCVPFIVRGTYGVGASSGCPPARDGQELE